MEKNKIQIVVRSSFMLFITVIQSVEIDNRLP